MDDNLQRDATKLLNQKLNDKTLSKEVQDSYKLLSKALREVGDTAKAAGKDGQDAMRSLSKSMEESHETMMGFVKDGISTGSELKNMFAAIAGMILDGPIQQLNKELEKEEAILKRLQDDAAKGLEQEKQVAESNIINLEEKLKLQNQICEDKTKCDEKTKKSLVDQIKNEKSKVSGLNDGIKIAKDKIKLDDDEIKKQLEKVNALKEQSAKMNAIKETVAKMLEVLSDSFDRFVELDKAAENFRLDTKLGKDQMVEIEKAALNINQELRSQGVTIEQSYRAAEGLVKAFSNAQTITQDQIRAVAQLNVNLGVSEDTAAGFLQKMESIGGMTEQQSIGMAGLTAGAAKAAGVPLDKVMKDVADASDETLSMMRGNVKQMTLAAIQANRLGVDLNKSATAAKGLLNFSQSVNDEMEASVLLGKNLNLNYARQLSFQGDVAGAQKEILNQVRSMGDFNKLNTFQQEALAKASGYSVSELTKMLKNEEKLSKLKPEQLKAYDDATNALKDQKEETGEQLLQQAQMQSAMKQLSNTFQTFKQIAADILTPVVNIAVKLLIPVLKLALSIFNFILIPVKLLAKALQAMWEPIEPAVQSLNDMFDGMNAKIEKFVQYFTDLGVVLIKFLFIETIFKRIFSVFTFIGSSISSIGSKIKYIGKPIELIGNAISFIGNMLKSFRPAGIIIEKIFSSVALVFKTIENISNRIIKPFKGLIGMFGTAGGMVGRFTAGFGSVGRIVGLIGTAGRLIPIFGNIVMAIQAVWGFFSRIMKGMSVFDAFGETLYDVLISPFEMLFSMLAKIPFIGKLFEPLLKIFPMVKEGIMSIAGYFKNIFSGKEVMSGLMGLGTVILKYLFILPILIYKGIVAIFPKIGEGFTLMFSKIKGWFTGLFSGGGGGKSISGTILSFLSSIPKLFSDNFLKVATFIPRMLFSGFLWYITTVPKFVWNLITGVFSKIKGWITGLFSSGEKSEGGMFGGIFKAITAVKTYIIDTFKSVTNIILPLLEQIATPFTLIATTILKIGELLITNFFKGLTSIASFIGGVLAFPFKLIAKIVGVDSSGIGPAETKTEAGNDVRSAIDETNRKLDQLINLMASGGIAVNLDGRKVSEQLAIASH